MNHEKVIIIFDKDGDVHCSAANEEIATAIAEKDQADGMEEMESFTLQAVSYYTSLEDV